MSVDQENLDALAMPSDPPEKTGKSRRGRKPGSVKKERPQLPEEAFDFSYVAENDRVKVKRRREDRGEQQEGIDDTVGDNYQDWLNAGQPTNWADMPVIVWNVPASFEEQADFMLKKAAQLHGRKIIWGHRTKNEETGKVTIPFCVIAKPPRKQTTTAE